MAFIGFHNEIPGLDSQATLAVMNIGKTLRGETLTPGIQNAVLSSSGKDVSDAKTYANAILISLSAKLSQFPPGSSEAKAVQAAIDNVNEAQDPSAIIAAADHAVTVARAAEANQMQQDVSNYVANTMVAQDAFEERQQEQMAAQRAMNEMYSDPFLRDFGNSQYMQDGLLLASLTNPEVGAGLVGETALLTAAPSLEKDIAAYQKATKMSLDEMAKIHEEINEGDRQTSMAGTHMTVAEYKEKLNKSTETFEANLKEYKKYAPEEANLILAKMNAGEYGDKEHDSPEVYAQKRLQLLADQEKFAQHFAEREQKATAFANATVSPEEKAALEKVAGPGALDHKADVTALAAKLGVSDPRKEIESAQAALKSGKKLSDLPTNQQALTIEQKREVGHDLTMFAASKAEAIQNAHLSEATKAEIHAMDPAAKVKAFKQITGLNDPNNMSDAEKAYAGIVKDGLTIQQQAKLIDMMVDGKKPEEVVAALGTSLGLSKDKPNEIYAMAGKFGAAADKAEAVETGTVSPAKAADNAITIPDAPKKSDPSLFASLVKEHDLALTNLDPSHATLANDNPPGTTPGHAQVVAKAASAAKGGIAHV